jgi:ABC-2 type transport system permease protein
MRVLRTLGFARALIGTNLKACFALRGAFWLSAGFMALNNLFFFITWWIFFERFEEVRGWRMADMAVLFGVVATGFGVTTVVAGGVRELSRQISDGDLDVLLTQPVPPLLHALGSRTWASGWGDIASGLLLMGLSGLVDFWTLPLALIAITASAATFTASGILLHSLAFWLGPVEGLVRQLWEFLLTFSMYPRTLFTGTLKILLFTVIPAGFIGFLPAELLQSFSIAGLLSVLAGASGYMLLALWVFARGLRRYESGNRFGVRA